MPEHAGAAAAQAGDNRFSITMRGLPDRAEWPHLVLSGGRSVAFGFLQEAEPVIEALRGVAETAVVGVPHPDFGEGLVAVRTPGAVVNRANTRAATPRHLAALKRPKTVVVNALPRNAMGKVQKALPRTKCSPLPTRS